MMLVPTTLDRSPIDGIGCFAAAFIPAGTRLWELTPGFDRVVDDATLASLPPAQAEQVRRYSYRDPTTGERIFCADNGRHFNFSATPNTGGRDGAPDASYALRDIAAGEELTFPVWEDADAAAKLQPATFAALQRRAAR